MVKVGNIGAEPAAKKPAYPGHAALENAHDHSHFQGMAPSESGQAHAAADANSHAVHGQADGDEEYGDKAHNIFIGLQR